MTQGSVGRQPHSGGMTNTPQPVIGPLSVTVCSTPGGIQPARWGGSNHEPWAVRTCTKPLSTQYNCPRACECQP